MSNVDDDLSAEFNRMTNLNPSNKQGWDSKASVGSNGKITHTLSHGSWGNHKIHGNGGNHRKSKQNKSRYRKKYKGTRINKTRRYKR